MVPARIRRATTILLVLFWGCAGPTAPTVPIPVLPPATPVSAIAIVGLPEVLNYEQSVQLIAMAMLPGGMYVTRSRGATEGPGYCD